MPTKNSNQKRIFLRDRLEAFTLKDVNGNILTIDQRQRFLGFLEELCQQNGKHIIYRGESLKNLKSQFRGNQLDENELAHYIFIMGEKARSCWDLKPVLVCGATTDQNFILILVTLKHTLESRDYDNYGKTLAMHSYKMNNAPFVDKIVNHMPDVIRAYNQLDDDEKELVNLFYITLLHTINWRAFGRGSTFISTTKSFQTAVKFSKDIVFVGWYPTSGTFGHNGGRVVNDNIRDNYKGIPLCSPVFYRQKEISLRCGLLPHFVLGYIVKATNEFFVNPGIKETLAEHRDMADIIENGLSIDQTDFLDYCRKTNFRYYFTVLNGHYELHRL